MRVPPTHRNWEIAALTLSVGWNKQQILLATFSFLKLKIYGGWSCHLRVAALSYRNFARVYSSLLAREGWQHHLCWEPSVVKGQAWGQVDKRAQKSLTRVWSRREPLSLIPQIKIWDVSSNSKGSFRATSHQFLPSKTPSILPSIIIIIFICFWTWYRWIHIVYTLLYVTF